MERVSRRGQPAEDEIDFSEDGPPVVYVRFKLGLIELDDVAQTFRPDVNVFMYYDAPDKIARAALRNKRQSKGVRYQNMARPAWVPHLDFNNEVEEPVVTDESYWFDTQDCKIFARLNVVPKIQERLDHAAFPFDRQILDLQLMSNNCQLAKWERFGTGNFPVELALARRGWVLQCELASVADSWDLHDVQVQIVNDVNACSALAHFQIFVERSSGYFLTNIGFVYCLIIGAQASMVIFPYNESRIDFAMALALTSVAFLFVSSTMVPKTSYLSVLDKYFILGLVLLALRFAADTIMQLTFHAPVGEEGYRGTCEDTPVDELSICLVDAIVTGALSCTWLAASLVFLLAGNRVFRPSWDQLNQVLRASVSSNGKAGSSKNTEYEVKGKDNMLVESRAISYEDLDNAVNIDASNRELRVMAQVQDSSTV